MAERIVTLPRCGKCADGKHSRCEHLVTICEDLDEWECCCVVKVEPSPRSRSTLQTPRLPLHTHNDQRPASDQGSHSDRFVPAPPMTQPRDRDGA